MKTSRPGDGYLVAAFAGLGCLVGIATKLFFGFTWISAISAFACGSVAVNSARNEHKSKQK